MATRTYRLLWLLPPLLLSLAVVASVMAWPHLPARMPIHWGISGEPTLLAPKGFAVAMLPAIMVWVGAFLGLILWSATRMNEGPLPAWLRPRSSPPRSACSSSCTGSLIATGSAGPCPSPWSPMSAWASAWSGWAGSSEHASELRHRCTHAPHPLRPRCDGARQPRGGRGLVVAGVLPPSPHRSRAPGPSRSRSSPAQHDHHGGPSGARRVAAHRASSSIASARSLRATAPGRLPRMPGIGGDGLG